MKIIGKTFEVSAYDGYAKYEVTEDHGDTVRIVSVMEDRGFSYEAPLLGSSCLVSKENVCDFISRRFSL